MNQNNNHADDNNKSIEQTNETNIDPLCNLNPESKLQINVDITPNDIAIQLVKSIVKSFSDNKEILSDVFQVQETTKSN